MYSVRKFLMFFCILNIFTWSSSAFATATTTTNADVFGDKFCQIIVVLQGKVGKAIATVAIIVVALGTFFGRFQLATALVTLCGIVIIFSAQTVVEMFSNNKAETNCTAASAPKQEGSAASN